MAAGSVVSSSTYRDQTRVYGSRVTAGFAYTKERQKGPRKAESETKVSHVRSLALNRSAISSDSPLESRPECDLRDTRTFL